MVDRFRLIYLKSAGPEKTPREENLQSQTSEGMGEEISRAIDSDGPETYSSLAILRQAKVDLRHPSPRVRRLAVRYLEKCGPSTAIPLLQEILSDRDPEMRVQGLTSLAHFQDLRVAPLLKKYFRDSDPRVRVAAVRGFFRREEKIDFNILLQCLSDESPLVRRKVATLLGWAEAEGVFPILMEMSKDTDPQVRKTALLSMMTLYPDEAEHRLLEMLRDSDSELRKWAKDILEKAVERPRKRKRFAMDRN